MRRLETVGQDRHPAGCLHDPDRPAQPRRRLGRHAPFVQIAILPAVRFAAVLPRLFARLQAFDELGRVWRNPAVRRVNDERGPLPPQFPGLGRLCHPDVVVLRAIDARFDRALGPLEIGAAPGACGIRVGDRLFITGEGLLL